MSESEKIERPSCEEQKQRVQADLEQKLNALGDTGMCEMLDIFRQSEHVDADISTLLQKNGFTSKQIDEMGLRYRALKDACPQQVNDVLDAGLPRLQTAKDNTQNCKGR